jgi:hypothetical protein
MSPIDQHSIEIQKRVLGEIHFIGRAPLSSPAFNLTIDSVTGADESTVISAGIGANADGQMILQGPRCVASALCSACLAGDRGESNCKETPPAHASGRA